MQVVLISPYGSIVSAGLRIISACLQEAGHEVRMIFLPTPAEIEPTPGAEFSIRYTEQQMEQIAALCTDAHLIGITVMTIHFWRTARLTDFLHQRVSAPIIWGGIHPTIAPKESLKHADMVCIGEGEKLMVELANRMARGEPYRDVKNLWLKDEDGRIITNELHPLVTDLDALPFPDYRLAEHYIMHNGAIRPLNMDLACWYLTDGYAQGGGAAYHIWATRGCPHHCSYCCNSAYIDLYPKWSHVRRLSNERMIAEINAMRAVMPLISSVAFMDDTFFAASTASLEDFAARYKKEVGLPFFCLTSPATLNERKFAALTDAGLSYVCMGIQSGSARIQELYQRRDKPERIVRAARIMNKFRERTRPPSYDVIIDNPYEIWEDQFATAQLMYQIPYPYRMITYSLTFYPGTRITEQAIAEGKIDAEIWQYYDKNYLLLKSTYYRFLLWGFHNNLNKSFLKPLIDRRVFLILNSAVFKPLWWGVGKFLDWYESRGLVKWALKQRYDALQWLHEQRGYRGEPMDDADILPPRENWLERAVGRIAKILRPIFK